MSLEQFRGDVNAVLPASQEDAEFRHVMFYDFPDPGSRIGRVLNPQPELPWTILAMADLSAPVVAISRDGRAGPRVTPVFFIGAANQGTLDGVMAGMYEGTDRHAPLFHQVGGPERPRFLVVPLMYHLTAPEAFVGAVKKYLAQIEGVVWFEESCEVKITHEGENYRAARGPDGSLRVVGGEN